jgi:hypothetical protein
MSRNNAISSTTFIGVLPAVLFAVSFLASCGGSNGSTTTKAMPVATAVSASGPSGQIQYLATADITWTSFDSTTCSSSPSGISGTAGTYTTPPLSVTTSYTITCTGPTGSTSTRVTIDVATTTYAHVAAMCAAEPMRGTVYYYCDCGTGADANCVAGDDTNAGTAPTAPRRTITDAVAKYNTLTGINTIAFCKGGAFDATPTYWLSLDNARCPAGTTCNDFREYTPTTFLNNATPTAKPIINNATAGVTTFAVSGNKGGVRFLNLALKGDNGALSNANEAFFFYRGAHDVTICNLDFDAFDMPLYNESGGVGDASTTNIKVTGSNITNSRRIAYLGGGDNAEISYNNWDRNGGSNMFDHTIYLASGKNISNMQMVGNYIHGQWGPNCYGSVMNAHASIDGLLIKDNTVVVEATQTTPGCWGLGFNNNTNATHAQYFRHAIFSGNTIINGGNLGFTVSSCPGCVIENNVVISNWASGGATGISVPVYGRNATRGDDAGTAYVIRNNTVWFGPNATGTSTGIDINTEGTDYIVSNNSVSSAQTVGSVNCFWYRLGLASYTFVNNNHCYSTVANKWETTQGSLATWRTYSAAYGFDTASVTGDPQFTTPGTNFVPLAGSPLVAAGTATQASAKDFVGKTRPNPPAIGAFEP